MGEQSAFAVLGVRESGKKAITIHTGKLPDVH
jgi:hypothetical protein